MIFTVSNVVQPSAQLSSFVPWRSTHVQHIQNDIFVDAEEVISVLFDRCVASRRTEVTFEQTGHSDVS